MFWCLNLLLLDACSSQLSSSMFTTVWCIYTFRYCFSDFGLHQFAPCKCTAVHKVLKEEFLGWGWGENRKAYWTFSIKWDILCIKYILSVFYFIGLYLERVSMRTDVCPPTLPSCVSSHEEEQSFKRKVYYFHIYISFVNWVVRVRWLRTEHISCLLEIVFRSKL